MPIDAMSRAVVTVSHVPERALRMPEAIQFDASARSVALSNRGVSL